MSTPVSLISEHMFCPPAGGSTLGGISVCFWIRRCLWVWATDWRRWNNTVDTLCSLWAKSPPHSHTFLLTQCQTGHIWKHNSHFLHFRLLPLQGSFIWNYPREPLCLKHKMIWKVKDLFFSLANLKAKGRCWKQKNHSLNSPGVDQRGSHKLQQRQRSTLLWKLASNTGNVSLFIPLILW